MEIRGDNFWDSVLLGPGAPAQGVSLIGKGLSPPSHLESPVILRMSTSFSFPTDFNLLASSSIACHQVSSEVGSGTHHATAGYHMLTRSLQE